MPGLMDRLTEGHLWTTVPKVGSDCAGGTSPRGHGIFEAANGNTYEGQWHQA